MPIAVGEQTNVPRNEAELNEATAKRLAAEAREKQAHEAARLDNQQMHMMQSWMTAFGGMYEIAAYTGQITPLINGAGHILAEVLANVPLKHREDEIRKVFAFIRSRRDEILNIRAQDVAMPANEPAAGQETAAANDQTDSPQPTGD